ncbi:MAG: glycosyltransferase family 2 protein, partial [Chlamydiia bacterium]|nr:glycosyltransferase family 2 protein [Chlamydiia bacterium]
SGSTDGTWESILRYNQQVDRIIRIRPEDDVPGRVLNLMVAMCREPIVILLSAEAIPADSEWIEKLIQPLLVDEADVSVSQQLPRPGTSFIVRMDYERWTRGGSVPPNYAAACAFKRSLWLETKFAVDGFSDELAWAYSCRKKGYRFRLARGSLVEHSRKESLSQVYQRGRKEGEADVYLHRDGLQLTRTCLDGLAIMVSDFLHAMRKGYLWTLPYNVSYRCAYYHGYCKGRFKAMKTQVGGVLDKGSKTSLKLEREGVAQIDNQRSE